MVMTQVPERNSQSTRNDYQVLLDSLSFRT
jgi:hypothetical protein